MSRVCCLGIPKWSMPFWLKSKALTWANPERASSIHSSQPRVHARRRPGRGEEWKGELDESWAAVKRKSEGYELILQQAEAQALQNLRKYMGELQKVAGGTHCGAVWWDGFQVPKDVQELVWPYTTVSSTRRRWTPFCTGFPRWRLSCPSLRSTSLPSRLWSQKLRLATCSACWRSTCKCQNTGVPCLCQLRALMIS